MLLPIILISFWLLSLGHSYHLLTFRSPGQTHPYGLPGLDENGYFAYAHSLAMDGDLDFRNQYLMTAARQGDDSTGKLYLSMAQTTGALGRPENFFPVGSGVISVPVLAMVRRADGVLARWTGRDPVHPWAALWLWLHQATQATLALIGALGMAYLAWHCTRKTSAVFLGTLAAITAGPAIFYWIWLPGMSHLTGWGLNAVALILWGWVWCGWRGMASGDTAGQPAVPMNSAPLSLRQLLLPGLGCGLCIGLATASRPYNLPMVLLGAEPLAYWLLMRWLANPKSDSAAVLPGSAAVQWAAITALGAIIGVLPQLLISKTVWGEYFSNSVGWKLQFPPPHALQILFSPRHGLFYWAPLLITVIPGLWLMVRSGGQCARLSWLIISIFLCWILMAGSWHIWWLGVAFGMRGAVDLTPLFAIPMAVLAAKALSSKHARTAILITCMAVALNMHLAIAYRAGSIWSDGPLQWSMTLSKPENRKALLRVDWNMWTKWSATYRHPLTAPPPGDKQP